MILVSGETSTDRGLRSGAGTRRIGRDHPRRLLHGVHHHQRHHGAVVRAVGIVSIAVGVLGLWGRIPLVVAPAANLRWIKGAIRTNGRIRVLGVFG